MIDTPESLNSRAWRLRRTRPTEAHTLATTALELCQSQNDPIGTAEAQITLSLLCIYKASFAEALRGLNTAMTTLKQTNHQSLILRALNAYGFAYINMGEYDKALPHLIEGLTIARSIPDYELATFILYNLSEILKDDAIRKYDEALAYLFEAERYCREGKSSVLALILSSIATTYHRIPDWENALNYANQAFEATKVDTDPATQDQCYNMIATLYYDFGHFESAKAIAKLSLPIQELFPNAHNITSLHLLLAKIYYKLNDFPSAIAHADSAYEMSVHNNLYALASEITLLLGELYEDIGDYQKAASYFKESHLYTDKRYSLSLEQRLTALTAEMQHEQLIRETEIQKQKNIELESLLNTLKSTQEQLIQSEKMAALGELIAGIAHEINSPFGAIQASTQSVLSYAEKALSNDLPHLLTEMDRGHRDLFFEMIRTAMHRDLLMPSREERKQRTLLEEKLKSLGFPEPWTLADTLIGLGLQNHIDTFLPILTSPIMPSALAVCKSLASILTSIENIRISVAKASKVIYALRYYTHQSPTESFEPGNIVEGLEQIINLFQNQTKNGIHIERQFSPIPSIPCRIDEINQVWMNLIQNALHAMGDSGHLILRVYPEPETIVVEVEDNGQGIPPEIASRIFEPFFTTKPQGVGSGLGLGFVKKIIDKHNGSIQFDSQPGKTNFKVKLKK